jgi:hypothetical protein
MPSPSREKAKATRKNSPSRFEAFGHSSKQKQRKGTEPSGLDAQRPNLLRRLNAIYEDLSISDRQQEQFLNHYGGDTDAGLRSHLIALEEYRDATIEALHYIHVRERSLSRLKRCAAAYQTKLRIIPARGEDVESTLATLDDVFLKNLSDGRDASLEVVRAISRWAAVLPPSLSRPFLWKGKTYIHKMHSDFSDIIDAPDCLLALERLHLGRENLVLIYYGHTGGKVPSPHAYWRHRRDSADDGGFLEGADLQEYVATLQQAEMIVRGLQPSSGDAAPETNDARKKSPAASKTKFAEWHSQTSELLSFHGIPTRQSQAMASRFVRNFISELDSFAGSRSAWWKGVVTLDFQHQLRSHWLERFVVVLTGSSTRRRLMSAWRTWMRTDRLAIAETKTAANDLLQRLKTASLTRFATLLCRTAKRVGVARAWRSWIQSDRSISRAIEVAREEQRWRIRWLANIVGALGRTMRRRCVARAWAVWCRSDGALSAAAIVASNTSALEAEFAKRISTQEGEFARKTSVLEAEFAERMSAQEAEFAKGISTQEDEFTRKISVLEAEFAERTSALDAEYAEQTADLQKAHGIEINALTDSVKEADSRLAEQNHWQDELQKELSSHVNDIERQLSEQSELYERATLKALINRVLGKVEQAWRHWVRFVAHHRKEEVADAQRFNEELSDMLAQQQKTQITRTMRRALLQIIEGKLARAWDKWTEVTAMETEVAAPPGLVNDALEQSADAASASTASSEENPVVDERPAPMDSARSDVSEGSSSSAAFSLGSSSVSSS